MPRVPLIAIVDDDDSLRNSLDDLLRSVGFQAHGFSSAEAFLRSQQVHETACLILDVRLPGMNGLALQRQLVVANWHIPIIFVTAYADDDARARPCSRRGGLFVQTLPRGGSPQCDRGGAHAFVTPSA
jgi:FixJ family two-component response regulator